MSQHDDAMTRSGHPGQLAFFGSQVTYTAPGGAGESVTMIAGRETLERDVQTGGKTDIRRRKFDVLVSDLAAAPVMGASVALDGVTYKVIEILSNGDHARLTAISGAEKTKGGQGRVRSFG